jgi:DNA-binding beta-propeller fold protein YncE
MRSAPVLVSLLGMLAAAGAAAAAQTHAFVVTTDYVTGGLSVIDLATRAVTPDVAGVHSDATLRWYQGRIYVVNRYGQDNIQVIDPAQGYATVQQFSVGNGSNPQDIAFASPVKAYVTRLASPDLLIVNPTTGAGLGSVPLGALADGDGIPEMARMMRVGRYLFVALQRMTNLVPASNPCSVAVVDMEADTLVDVDPATPGTQAIELAGRNPITTFAYDRSRGLLLLGCAGAYGALDGGIEWLDPVAFRSRGYAITEAALGGDVLDFAWNGPGRSYAIVSDAGYNTSLVTWSASTGQKLATVYSPGGFSLADCELDDRGELYVCNSSFTGPGVFVFRTSDDALVAGPLDTGLPPYQVTFDAESDVATGVRPTATGEFELSPAWPNPARGTVRFELSLAHPAAVQVDAFDLAGRRVRTLAHGTWPAGAATLRWALDDERGRPLPAGLYLVRARLEGQERVRRVVVLD